MKKANFILNAALLAVIALLLTLINKSPKSEHNNSVSVSKTTDPVLKDN